jgi:hypothetical protein
MESKNTKQDTRPCFTFGVFGRLVGCDWPRTVAASAKAGTLGITSANVTQPMAAVRLTW